MVFDFGGGTCDVFVARLSPSATGAPFAIETRSVSRYHRLGGGDFDAAIIHGVLLPQLLKENALAARHFEWGDQKKIIEPALRGCALIFTFRNRDQTNVLNRAKSADARPRRQSLFFIVFPAFFLAPIHLQDLSWKLSETKFLSIGPNKWGIIRS